MANPIFMAEDRAVTPDGYYCVGCWHSFYLTSWSERGQCPWFNAQGLHVLKILAAHWLKIAAAGRRNLKPKWSATPLNGCDHTDRQHRELGWVWRHENPPTGGSGKLYSPYWNSVRASSEAKRISNPAIPHLDTYVRERQTYVTGRLTHEGLQENYS